MDGTRRAAVKLARLRRRPRSAARRGPRGLRYGARTTSAEFGESCRACVARAPKSAEVVLAPYRSERRGALRIRIGSALDRLRGWCPVSGRFPRLSERARCSATHSGPRGALATTTRRPRSAAEQRALSSRPGGPPTPGYDPRGKALPRLTKNEGKRRNWTGPALDRGPRHDVPEPEAATAHESTVRRREGIPPAKPAQATSALTRRDHFPRRGNELQPRARLKQPEHRPKPNTRAKRGVATESPQTQHDAGAPRALHAA